MIKKILMAINEYLAINDRWITIHPHGKDSDDYRRLKIEGDETPKEAIDRVYKKEEKKEQKKDGNSFVEKHKKLEQEYQELMGKREAIREDFTKRLNKYMEEHPKYKYARAEKEFRKEFAKEVEEKEKENEDLYSKIIDKDHEIDMLHREEGDRLNQLKIDELNKNELEQFLNDFEKVNRGRLSYDVSQNLFKKQHKAKERLDGLGYQEKRKSLIEVNGVKKKKPMTHEEADNGHVNPNYEKGIDDKGYSTNCQSCVVCYELRRRGFDLQTRARQSFGKMQILAEKPEMAYIDPNTGKTPEVNRMYVGNKNDAYGWLDNNIKDGRYVFRVKWKNYHSGHIISAERINGNLTLYDPQNNKLYDTKDKILERLDLVSFRGYSKDTKPFILRVDNLDIKQDFADAITVKE